MEYFKILRELTRQFFSPLESRHKSFTAAVNRADRNKCAFCRIIDGKQNSKIYYEDDEIMVFNDIKPKAKYHLLVVPREHICDCSRLMPSPSHLSLLNRLVQIGNKVLLEQIQKVIPETRNLDQIDKLLEFHWPPFNTVPHLHLHVIAPKSDIGFLSRNIILNPAARWFVTPEYVKKYLEKMLAQSADA